MISSAGHPTGLSPAADCVLVGPFQANLASPKAWYPRARDATVPVKGSLCHHPSRRRLSAFGKLKLNPEAMLSHPPLNRALRREVASWPGCQNGLLRLSMAGGLRPLTSNFLFRISPTNLTANVLATTATTSKPHRLNSPLSLFGPRPTDEPTCGPG